MCNHIPPSLAVQSPVFPMLPVFSVVPDQPRNLSNGNQGRSASHNFLLPLQDQAYAADRNILLPPEQMLDHSISLA